MQNLSARKQTRQTTTKEGYMACAGWSSIDSTPPLGLPMGGRGPRFYPGGEVLDPLAAQVVVLEDAKGARTIWMSIDMIGMSWAETSGFRHELSAMTGVPFESILVNFSHTHSGPMSGYEGYATLKPKPKALADYELNLMTRCVRMTLDAVENMRDVTVIAHRGQSDIGINRRLREPDGTMVMGPNPDGHYNSDLWVLDLQAKTDRCILFSYGCHPVMVYGYAWDGISADWPGKCRDRMSETLGCHAQFIQGFAGNVKPRRLADLESHAFRKATPEDVVATGHEIADDVARAIESGGEEIALDLANVSGFAMTPRDHTNVADLAHWEVLANSDEEINQNLGEYWYERLKAGIPPVKYLPWSVGLIRLAPGHQIAWMANEVLGEWLHLLREWLSDPNLIGWGYCQDGRNYMPTDELIHEGGYEVDRANTFSRNGPGPVAQGINEAVKQTFLEMKDRLTGNEQA
jgi:neutral ceramidase